MINQINEIYNQFLNIFPESIRGFVSIGLGILLIISIFQIIKKNFIYIILLVVLLPASIPILKNIWESAVKIIKLLLARP